MEQEKAALEKLDLQNLTSQEKQTGSPETCRRHHTELDNFGRCNTCFHEELTKKHFKESRKEAYEALSVLPPRLKLCTFDLYKPANSKAAEALAICKKFAEECAGGGLIMLGGVGTGKTHLAIAICKAICAIGKRSTIATVTDIIREVRSTWIDRGTDSWGEKVTEKNVIDSYSLVPLLVIDEIGSQYGTDSEKILISEIINNRYNHLLPTIIIGNITYSQAVEYLGERAIDRIKHNGKVIAFDWDSYRKEYSA